MSDERSDFWSRRKARVQAEAQAEARAEAAEAVAAREAELAEKTDAEILAELDLPDPDSLQQGDDFSVFMKHAVPERIRRRALRKLWLSNPVLANLDALVEYGEDYTDAATVVENLSTAYQVGKGMLSHIVEMERQEAERNAALESDGAAPAVTETLEAAPDAPEPPENDPGPEMAPESADQPATLVVSDKVPVSAGTEKDDYEDGVLSVRRRMRFDFAG